MKTIRDYSAIRERAHSYVSFYNYFIWGIYCLGILASIFLGKIMSTTVNITDTYYNTTSQTVNGMLWATYSLSFLIGQTLLFIALRLLLGIYVNGLITIEMKKDLYYSKLS